MIRDYIQMCFLTVIGGVTLFFFVLFNSVLSARKKAAFLIACGISLLMVVCNIITYIYQDLHQVSPVLHFITAVSYAISGSVVMPFIVLSSVISQKIRRVLYLLAVGNALLSFVSIFNGCIFSFNAQGETLLGVLSPIPFFLTALYIFVLLVASLFKFRLGFRNESIFLTILSIAIISAAVLNTAFHFKFLISGMAVLSCIFYYLFFTTQTLTRDAMTNALNRHSFYKDVEQMKKRNMTLISIDLNGLKQINDTLGHDAGDKAIFAVSQCLFGSIPPKCRLYRMGGDEFEILCPSFSLRETETLVQRIRESVSNAGYSIAVGYGEYTKDTDFERVFNAADEMMYADKHRIKQQCSAG